MHVSFGSSTPNSIKQRGFVQLPNKNHRFGKKQSGTKQQQQASTMFHRPRPVELADLFVHRKDPTAPLLTFQTSFGVRTSQLNPNLWPPMNQEAPTACSEWKGLTPFLLSFVHGHTDQHFPPTPLTGETQETEDGVLESSKDPILHSEDMRSPLLTHIILDRTEFAGNFLALSTDALCW